MTIHLYPVTRAVPRLVAESRALFLAKRTGDIAATSATRREVIERLCKSPNAAISNAGYALRESLPAK